MLTCPFCGAPETDRIDLEGERFVVFRCMFTPQIDPKLSEAELPEYLREAFGENGTGYFRGMCDRLHLYVAKGEGARRLLSPSGSDSKT